VEIVFANDDLTNLWKRRRSRRDQRCHCERSGQSEIGTLDQIFIDVNKKYAGSANGWVKENDFGVINVFKLCTLSTKISYVFEDFPFSLGVRNGLGERYDGSRL
jgi:hypothetical protein